MIPMMDDILRGFKSGVYTFEQCMGWIDSHMDAQYNAGLNDAKSGKQGKQNDHPDNGQ